jgi:hypothetical protein
MFAVKIPPVPLIELILEAFDATSSPASVKLPLWY